MNQKNLLSLNNCFLDIDDPIQLFKIWMDEAIKTEQDYENALEDIAKLMDAEPDTPKGDKLDVLTTLVEAYERKHFAIDLPDPVEAIKFRMEQMGLRNVDVAPFVGGANRVSEILHHKRKLTVDMMKSLKKNLGIPAESLLA